jgi:hypothetical protein
MSERRFPPPWSVDETDACFIVKDHAGQALTYVYFAGRAGLMNGSTFCSRATKRGG